MSTLQENNYKRFSIETKASASKEYFNFGGVSKLEVKGHTAEFIFKGNINSIMKKIAEIDITNISIDEPDLEEIFMHYYAKEN